MEKQETENGVVIILGPGERMPGSKKKRSSSKSKKKS
jgi:hypothetical protein